MSFENPIPVAVTLIPVLHNNEIFLLGVKRGIEPKIGEIALPGGYTDKMETIRIAAARELKEETTYILAPEDFELFDEHIAPNNRLLIFALSKNVVPSNAIDWNHSGPETEGLVLIDQETAICFPLHKKAIDRFFKEVAPRLKPASKLTL